MPNSLSDLHQRTPREKSGARVAARFEFQANFSILKMLDLHEAGTDYRILFDHFDDLTILNSSAQASHISFYQVKGRSGEQSWTIKQLVNENEEAARPRSIIGKMYKNAADFPMVTERIVFASNASFKIRLKDGTKTNADNSTILGVDIHPDELQLVDAVLETDFPSPRTLDVAGILLFERTDLPLQNQALFVTGRLVQLLESLAQAENVPIKALYDVIYRNVISKAASTETCETINKFHERKSLTRDDIALLINRATNCRQFHLYWPAIASELTSAGYSVMDLLRMQNAALAYLRARAKGDKRPNQLSQEIGQAFLDHHAGLEACKTILDAANLLANNLADLHGFGGNELLSALFVEISERAND